MAPLRLDCFLTANIQTSMHATIAIVETNVQRVDEPLPNAFLCVNTGRNVKRSLISLGILHDGRCLALYGKNDGSLGLP